MPNATSHANLLAEGDARGLLDELLQVRNLEAEPGSRVSKGASTTVDGMIDMVVDSFMTGTVATRDQDELSAVPQRDLVLGLAADPYLREVARTPPPDLDQPEDSALVVHGFRAHIDMGTTNSAHLLMPCVFEPSARQYDAVHLKLAGSSERSGRAQRRHGARSYGWARALTQ